MLGALSPLFVMVKILRVLPLLVVMVRIVMVKILGIFPLLVVIIRIAGCFVRSCLLSFLGCWLSW